jgi:hypothetical protein
VEEKEMKKLMSIMAACLLVFGFAATASADFCAQCEVDPGYIDAGCEGVQESCYPFDYENLRDYCSAEKDEIHRAIFELCDCYPDLVIGDTIFVSMEILVDTGTGTPVTGDNGVYWAEDVGTCIPVEAFRNQADICDDRGEMPADCFAGEYIYRDAAGDEASPYEESDCAVDEEYRAVVIEPNVDMLPPGTTPAEEGWGYELTESNAASLWIDIPEMRADPNRVMKGYKVYVQICIDRDIDDICGSAACCCLIYIGELCCPDLLDGESSLIFPYFTAADSGWWSGLAITNVGDDDGEVTLMLYEQDGDSFETVDPIVVPAKSMVVFNQASLYGLDWNATLVEGTAANSRYYVEAVGNFPMMGFGMMAKTATGESMGYLAMPKWLSITSYGPK